MNKLQKLESIVICMRKKYEGRRIRLTKDMVKDLHKLIAKHKIKTCKRSGRHGWVASLDWLFLQDRLQPMLNLNFELLFEMALSFTAPMNKRKAKGLKKK